MDSASTRTFRKTVVWISVCIASTLAGGVAGFFATSLYPWDRDRQMAGAVLSIGFIAGLAVALAWCLAMRRWTRLFAADADSSDKLRRRGLAAGMVSGIVATLGLHLGLMAASDEWAWLLLWGGQVFGIPAGVLVGLFGGSLWAAAYSAKTPQATEAQ